MKKCPQCNSVFEDEKTFCTNDGSKLVLEELSLPSDFMPEDHDDGEQETVMRYKPINVDISDPKIPQQKPQAEPTPQPQVNQYAPNHSNLPPQTPAKPKGGCIKYSIILLIGLLIGGGIALGVVGVGYIYLNNLPNENQNTNKNQNVNNNSSKNKNSNSNKKLKNKHSERNAKIEESKLNGRVIKRLGVLRSSPNNKARRIDRLPKNDRLEIIKRKSATSRWYQVECEHGSRGWIDGYSIEFTQEGRVKSEG